jgi:hypothetical protein
VVRLEDVARLVGGRISFPGDRMSLETQIGGLRAFVVRRVSRTGRVILDVAVLTSQAPEQELDFEKGYEWVLDDEPAIPRLESSFVFAGCRRGVLYARNIGEPSLEAIVATLWQLAEWARKPWRPLDERDFEDAAASRRSEARSRLLRLLVISVLILYCLWALAAC